MSLTFIIKKIIWGTCYSWVDGKCNTIGLFLMLELSLVKNGFWKMVYWIKELTSKPWQTNKKWKLPSWTQRTHVSMSTNFSTRLSTVYKVKEYLPYFIPSLKNKLVPPANRYLEWKQHVVFCSKEIQVNSVPERKTALSADGGR